MASRFSVTLDPDRRIICAVKAETAAGITLLSLPPYSPELNPMEKVWDCLRHNKPCATVYENDEAIVDACKTAWNRLIDDPERMMSIGNRDGACASLSADCYKMLTSE